MRYLTIIHQAKRAFRRLTKGVAGDQSEYVPTGIHDETAYMIPSGQYDRSLKHDPLLNPIAAL